MPITIYDYTDYRKYLKDWLEERAGRPSLRGFAKKVECSPSLLSSVTNGARDLAAPLADKVVAAIGLDPDERTYFLDLVAFEQAANRAQRREALDRIMAVRRFRASARLEDAMYLVFSRWYYGAILELCRAPAFREDPAWIASRLVPEITPAEAAEALDVLLGNGLLIRRPDGRLDAPSAAWTTGHEVAGRVKGAALAIQYRWVFQRASEALEEFAQEERHFGVMFLGLPVAAIPDLKATIKRFQEDVIARFGALENTERVYALSTQLFPLSKAPDAAD